MDLQVLSVNIGQRRTQPKGNALEATGIYKSPTREPVQISRLGIREDFIGDPKFHGGPDQAIYLYGESDYAWWSKQLAQELQPGTFGENLTLSDFESANFHIGDRLEIGSVVFEFTAPRTPCSTLARRMGDPMFVKKYRRAERPGIYCRVVQDGILQVGQHATLVPRTGEVVAAIDIFRDHYERDKDEGKLRRFLRAPIASRTRADLEHDLQKLLGS
jgi:MOSC domain-containing protein YiiM